MYTLQGSVFTTFATVYTPEQNGGSRLGKVGALASFPVSIPSFACSTSCGVETGNEAGWSCLRSAVPFVPNPFFLSIYHIVGLLL